MRFLRHNSRCKYFLTVLYDSLCLLLHTVRLLFFIILNCNLHNTCHRLCWRFSNRRNPNFTFIPLRMHFGCDRLQFKSTKVTTRTISSRALGLPNKRYFNCRSTTLNLCCVEFTCSSINVNLHSIVLVHFLFTRYSSRITVRVLRNDARKRQWTLCGQPGGTVRNKSIN